MKANANPIVLKSNRTSDECIGTVRLTPEAEKVIRRLRAKTALGRAANYKQLAFL